jgi:hypothetical protein
LYPGTVKGGNRRIECRPLKTNFRQKINYQVERAAKEEDVQAMQEGQTIKHGVYGLGIVTASDGERTAVDFDDHGPKLFVTSIMTAELIGEAPATPPKTKRRRKASTAAKAAKAAKKAAAASTA